MDDCIPAAEPRKLALDLWFYAGAAFAAVDLLGRPSERRGDGVASTDPTPN